MSLIFFIIQLEDFLQTKVKLWGKSKKLLENAKAKRDASAHWKLDEFPSMNEEEIVQHIEGMIHYVMYLYLDFIFM